MTTPTEEVSTPEMAYEDFDIYVSKRETIRVDSDSKTLKIPVVDEVALLRMAEKLDKQNSISLIFLLVSNQDQAYKLCQLIENGQLANGESPGIFVIKMILSKMKQTPDEKTAIFVSLLSALELVSRLVCYVISSNLEENTDLNKNVLFETVRRHRKNMLQDRIRLFQVASNMTIRETKALYYALKNSDNETSQAVEDSVPWTDDREADYSCESILLLFMKKYPSEQLFSKLEKELPNICTELDDETYSIIFSKVFGACIAKADGSPIDTERRSLKKGSCLIINNEKFYDPKLNRQGSEKDVRELKKVWKAFNCDVTIKKDRTAIQMGEDLVEFQTYVDNEGKRHGDDYFVVICILSHGRQLSGQDQIMGIDGIGIFMTHVLDKFIDHNKCPGMRGKVKIFLIQACRNVDNERPNQSSRINETDSLELITTDGAGHEPRRSSNPPIPNKTWHILNNSTIEGEVSYRSSTNGSFFIQAVCEKLIEKQNTMDINNIFTLANDKAYQDLVCVSNNKQYQSASIKHTFLLPVYLPPVKTIVY